MSTSLLEAAIELARVTGNVALHHYRENQRTRSLAIETKADGSPVSIADREADSQLVPKGPRDWKSPLFGQMRSDGHNSADRAGQLHRELHRAVAADGLEHDVGASLPGHTMHE